MRGQIIQSRNGFRVRASDDAGQRVAFMLRPFAPWSARASWGLPEPALPLLVFIIVVAGIVVLARFQGPWVVAVLLFSPMATSWIGVTVLLVIWTMRAWPRHLSRSRAAALYRDRCCAGCGYALSEGVAKPGLSHEPVLTRCPECGAQWDMRPPEPTKWLRLSVEKGISRAENEPVQGQAPSPLDPRGEAG
jgi:hypothetical protein